MSCCRWSERALRRRSTRCLLAALAVGVALASTSHAQEPPREEPAVADEAQPEEKPEAEEQTEELPPSDPGAALPSGVEVIRVVGEDIASDIAPEVAQSVTQFDAEALQALGAQNVSDLATFTPNLEIKTAGATAPTFFIRGVGLNDFAANGSGAVAIYQDDVPRNAPAIQLGQFFDLENVEILKGPQGGGSGRNASAGAIFVNAIKPQDELGAGLTTTIGNYNLRDFEGFINAPMVEGSLSSRMAFRFTERDPILQNRCSRIPERADAPNLNIPGQPFIPSPTPTNPQQGNVTAGMAGQHVPAFPIRRDEALIPAPNTIPVNQRAAQSQWHQVSFCGENRFTNYPLDPRPPPPGLPSANWPNGRQISILPGDLPDKVNDIGNWSARGALRFQPEGTDMDWIVNGHGGRMDQYSTLGQAIGTRDSRYGGPTAFPYRDRDVVSLETRLRKPDQTIDELNALLAQHLAEVGDDDPWKGDYNRTGKTRLDTWGSYVRGDWTLPEVTLTSLTGYDAYDRWRDTDQDFTPDTLFESEITDDAWQITQELKAEGEIREGTLRWNAGAFTLNEKLDYYQKQFFRGTQGNNSASDRTDIDYTQNLYSWAAFAGGAWDFLDDFTLEAGGRYNWEQKRFDSTLTLVTTTRPPIPGVETETWHAPTGTVTLLYRLQEETAVYWKYSRGWKGGHFSALPQDTEKRITLADPETIDAFEIGLNANWFEGRLGFRAQLFYYNYQDYQVLTVEDTVAGPPAIAIINANDAEIYGSEIEVRAEPVEALVFTGRFGWLESQYLDFTNEITQSVQGPNNTITNLVVTVDYTGNRLINSPQFKFSGAVDYTFELGRYGALLPRVDFAWSDDTYFDPAEGRGNPNAFGQQFLPRFAVGQPAYWIFNGRLGYRTEDGTIEIAGWVRNFMDTTYKTYGFDASQFSSVQINYYGEPRTYGMDFTVRF
jgi:outer membrane receptor protein involved in Fe transport